MSNTINWGKIYEKTAWGIGVVANTISWGKIYANLAGSIPSFALDFANIANDFTFTRSSFATRVNEFGLIETVTDLGSDLVTNGTFDTDLSGWSIQGGNTNWVWDNGTATMNGGVESGLTQAIGDNTTLYQVTIEVVALNGSSLRVLDASSGNVFLSEGINTIQTTLLGGVLYIKPSAIVGDIVIDNVSVKEVLEDDVPRIDYSGSTFDVPVLGDELIDYSAIGVATGGWSLVNGKWFFDDITAGHLETESFYAVVGEQYEVTVDVSIESGNANFRFTSGNSQTILFNYIDFPNGVTKFITTVSGVDGFINRLFASQNPTDNPFTLNSISVKKVTAYTTEDKGSFLLEPQSANLYLNSETLSTQDVTTLASTYTISFRGTGSITLSGSASGTLVGTGAMDLVSLTFVATAGTLTSTVSGSVKYSNLENLGYATSWIPTNGAIATRSAETCVDATPTINSEEGVLYAEISALTDTNTNLEFISITDGLYTRNSVYIQLRSSSNQIGVWSYSNSVNQVAETLTLTDITEFNKIAILYKENEFKVYINGVLVFTELSYNAPTADSLNRLDFGRDGSLNFYGNTKDLKIYDKALTDDELITITSI